MQKCGGKPCPYHETHQSNKFEKINMAFNPKIHHRRSIRLKGYDYSQAGLYFITSCCEDRKCRFGHIENNEMILNEFGIIAYNEWIKLTERFSNFELDTFQIMPNHMHGIIVLNDAVGSGLAPALRSALYSSKLHKGQAQGNADTNTTGDDYDMRAGASPSPMNSEQPPTISDIVGSYKSLVANECLKIYKNKNEIMGKFWQRDYYEHIIRNQSSYKQISEYINSNPSTWKDDKFYI